MVLEVRRSVNGDVGLRWSGPVQDPLDADDDKFVLLAEAAKLENV